MQPLEIHRDKGTGSNLLTHENRRNPNKVNTTITILAPSGYLNVSTLGHLKTLRRNKCVLVLEVKVRGLEYVMNTSSCRIERRVWGSVVDPN